MKKYQFILAALLAIAACQKNEVAPETIDDEPVWGYVTAVADVPQTKAVLVDEDGDKNWDFAWSVGDKLTILVYKGNDTKPGYARREASISQIVDGVATIKYEKGTGKNEATGIAGAWYPVRNNADNLPDQSVPTTQDFSKGQVSIPLVADNVSMSSPMSPGAGVTESGKVYDSKNTLHFSVNPAIGADGYSVLGFRLTKGNAERTIKSIKVNNGREDYMLTEINTALTDEDDVQYFYIVLPASSTPLSKFKATIVANDGANDLEYTRTKASYTPQAGTVTLFPIISDLDETGKYRWKLGTSGSFYPADVVAKSIFRTNPFTAITNANESRPEGNTTIGSNYITLQTGNAASPYRGDFALMSFASSHIYYGKMDGSDPILYRTASDAERLTVHAGNYPIVAVKMTNLRKNLNGDSNYSLKLNVKQREGGSIVLEANNYSWHKTRVIGEQTDTEQNIAGDDALVYWFELTSNSFKTGSTKELSYPTTQTKDICDLGFILADIKNQATAPTVDIYWIGTFSSTSELEDFASKN